MVNETTAEKFSAYMKKYPDLYASLAQSVQAHCTTPHPLILDIGSGPGLLAVELGRLMPQATLLGLDPLPTMLRLAQDNTRQQKISAFCPLCGSSEHLPLKNNTVDIIVSRFSLTYWQQPQQSFHEMTRVVKPGGIVILEALNRTYPPWKLRLIQLHMMLNRAGRDVTTYHVDAYKTAYTLEQVQHFLSTAGLMVLTHEGNRSTWKFKVIAQKKGL
ncbi:MAG: class I SAM-dependent methyltransferase [Candidatus Thermoplasmatota archaeon]|nr:class I SAM-dependent methyltransferase [Candidatus Thermoplasmatota archaeon]